MRLPEEGRTVFFLSFEKVLKFNRIKTVEDGLTRRMLALWIWRVHHLQQDKQRTIYANLHIKTNKRHLKWKKRNVQHSHRLRETAIEMGPAKNQKVT